MYYAIPNSRLNQRFRRNEVNYDEELDGIGSFFKKIGKGALKIAGASGIPGISQVAGIVDGLIPQGGGGKSEEKLRKDCAKKPSKKGCAELFAQDKARADAQAKAEAAEAAKVAREEAMIAALTNKQNSSGIDTNTMMLIGGGVGAVLLLVLLTKN